MYLLLICAGTPGTGGDSKEPISGAQGLDEAGTQKRGVHVLPVWAAGS